MPFLGLSSLGSPQNQRFSFGLGSQNRIDGIPRAAVGVRPHVRVGVQGLFGRLVTQSGLNDLHRSPGVDEQARVVVPQLMEVEPRQALSIELPPPLVIDGLGPPRIAPERGNSDPSGPGLNLSR